jgi:hypothetical protein
MSQLILFFYLLNLFYQFLVLKTFQYLLAQALYHYPIRILINFICHLHSVHQYDFKIISNYFNSFPKFVHIIPLIIH